MQETCERIVEYESSRHGKVKAYLHAAICRADLSAPRNREANRRV